MLLPFLFVLLLFALYVCVCFFFSRDSNMIYMGTVEFIYYVAIIMPVNLNLKL